MQAIVLAGGMGTRLRPLTYTRPKPMIVVANRPAIHHLVVGLAEAGFSEVIVTTNYMAENIRAYCEATSLPIPVRCIDEERPMGTAGAVKNVESEIAGPFAVIQGDSLSEIDLRELVAAHRRFGGLATLAVMPVENPSEFGIVELDAGARIVRFLEKPKREECFSNLANTGFYVLEREVLAEIPAEQTYDFSFELFPKLLASGQAMHGWRTQAYWIDLGRVGTYLAGNARCLSRLSGWSPPARADISPTAAVHLPSLVGEGSILEAGCEVGPEASVGSDVRLQAGCRVRGSILYDRVSVGQNTLLEECVVSEETVIGRNASVGRLAIIGRGCHIGDGAKILEGSRVGPFSQVEPETVVDGVLSPNLERITHTQTLLAAHPAFAGLTPEGVSLCTALAELGEAPAKTLARLAHVPFSRIHGLLFELGRRGLVVAQGEAPKLFSLVYENPDRIALWERLRA